MGCFKCLCTSFNSTVLSLAATIYFAIGIGLIAGATATFFTPFGQILTTLYAVSSLGIGIGIVFVSLVGFMAACGKHKCWLGLFALLDLLIIVLIVISVVLMFEFEWVMKQAGSVGAAEEIESSLDTLNVFQANLVSTLTKNTFDACQANTTMTGGDIEFSCGNDYFESLGESIGMCVDDINVTAAPLAGSVMFSCYNSTVWESTPMLTPATFFAVLNTPKGIFCACASSIMNDFVLKYLHITKWVAIGVASFFGLIFLSCCYLCCVTKGSDTCCPCLCCCKGGSKSKNATDSSAVGVQFNTQQRGWSAGSVSHGVSGKNAGRRDPNFHARP